MIIDLNCDMGELEDAAREEALMRHIASASIACGGHAGSAETMDRTVRLALRHGVRIGAHPGYPDRANFGRAEMSLSAEALAQSIEEQIASLVRRAAALGASVEYCKPHGALYNAAARDEALARAVGLAVARWNPGGMIFGLAGSRALGIWRDMGLTAVPEGFAERRYEPDGGLRPRSFPDAVIHSPAEAAAQALVLARSGRVETICVHGDSPNAEAVVQAVAAALRR